MDIDTVRIGIIGVGGMGSHHAKLIKNGQVPCAKLAAVCDINPERLTWAEKLGVDGLVTFIQPDDFFAKADVDAVIIATPHYAHPTLAIRAFERGWHVMTEKPAGVYTGQVKAMNAAAEQSGKVFGIMYNQRTLATHQKMREMVQSGELGALRRINWIITDWFRSQSYYDHGGWRATWVGEGGGVLINQCPHNLDLWQWICGMPKRVRAFAGFGKYHRIEVEDEVTAYAEYENGATALFVTSTGEAPGTNRFEIVGDRGKMVLEQNQLTFWRNRVPMDEFLRESKSGFAKPECWRIELPVGEGEQHAGILKNWISAIRSGTPLLAPGVEGLRGLEISNAIHLSAWTQETVELPVDADLFYRTLQEQIAKSTPTKPSGPGQTMNVDGTF